MEAKGGAERGVSATKEYQVCFKCHSGGSANKFSSVNESSPNRRVIQEPDQERRFEAGNPSFHPVTAQRRGTGASLATELQSGMLQVYCSDCHNSDESARAGGTGPNGPHGSRYRHILMLRYDMPLFQDPRPPYSASLYDLCFRCHAESYVMGNGSAFNDNGDNMHDMHVREERVPCFACHDPHGVSIRSVPAATAANNAHLINLNLNYAANAEVPSPFYVTNSPGTGSCTVRCHSTGDRTRTYEP